MNPIEPEQAQPPQPNLSCPLASAPHHSLYCPNCSARLTEHRCKLVCRACGYYLSCADYY